VAKAKAAQGLSVNELAKALGRDRATVLRWIANEGLPTCGSRAVGARIEWRAELPAVVRWLEQRARLAERERVEARVAPELDRLRRALEHASGADGEPVTWQEARRRRTLAEAQLRELEVAEKEGELVDARGVEIQWAGIAALIKARLLAVAPKTAVHLAGMAAPAACHALVESEIRDALTALADSGLTFEETPDGGLRAVAGDVEVVARVRGSTS